MKKLILLFSLSVFSIVSCSEEKKSGSKEETPAETKEVSLRSDITCPECGFTKNEMMPTEQCLLKYTCEKCKTELFAREGDCCVFCSYGTVKCPSMEGK